MLLRGCDGNPFLIPLFDVQLVLTMISCKRYTQKPTPNTQCPPFQMHFCLQKKATKTHQNGEDAVDQRLSFMR